MPLISPVRIDAPPVVPARGGLLSVANIFEAAAGSRVEFGVNYYTYLCGTAGLFDPWCVETPGVNWDFTKQFSGGSVTEGWPFVVYAGVQCDLFGREEYAQAARDKLAGGEERAVASAFLGQLFATGTPVEITATLSSPPTPAELLEAVALLEQYAGENYAGRPVIHMSRANAIRLASETVLVPTLDGGLETILGTPVAASPGYPDDLVFATGAVHLWRTAINVVTTDTVLQNTAEALAERVYVAATDCLLAFIGTEPPPPPGPTIGAPTPASGPIAGGTTVTIPGTNFGTATAVLFGTTPAASFTVISPTEIRAVTPAHAAGAVDVTITSSHGDATRPNAFTFNAPPPPAPTIASTAPNTGAAAGGTGVVITGTNFTGATGVTFGGTPGTGFSVTDATHIAVTTAAHAAGQVAVVVQHPSGNATQANGFTYTA